jgi:hypothetical protein
MAALNDSVMQTVGTPQTVAYTGTAANSTAIGGSTGTGPFAIVCLTSTTACFWRATAAGTAATTTTGEYLPADVPHYKKVNKGDIISVIELSSGGNLYITEQV